MRNPVAALATGIFCFLQSHGASAQDSARPSLVPALLELKTTFTCIDRDVADSHSTELSERRISEIIEGCADEHSVGNFANPLALEYGRTEDFESSAIVIWAQASALSSGSLVEQFDHLIDTTKCAEGEFYERSDTLTARKGKVVAAMYAAFEPCLPRFQIYANGHALASQDDEARRRLATDFASTRFAKLAIHYVVTASGWLPDEWRTCGDTRFARLNKRCKEYGEPRAEVVDPRAGIEPPPIQILRRASPQDSEQK